MIPIDIIIANRNNAHFLPQCLESVLSQTLAPAEVIVIDDASTDDSMQVMEPYVRQGRIKVIRNETVLGVSRSRCKAIAYGRSAYLSTLDADDYFYDTRKLAAEATAIGGSGSGKIGFSDVMRVDENGEDICLVSSWRRLRDGDLSFHIRYLNGFIPRDYVVSREDYMAVGGYDQTLNIYEDWDLKIRLAQRCTWHSSGVVGTAYRDNPQGLSRTPMREHIKTMRRIFLANCPEKRPLLRAAEFARFFFYHSRYLGRPAI